MKAVWNNTIIADSADTVVVEGNHYFALSDVNREFLRESEHTSYCPWKGTAHYFSLEVDGQSNPDAAWYYPEPKPEASEIGGRIAFWKGVEVT
jgi:uncharacterized protein (DUF427 family)